MKPWLALFTLTFLLVVYVGISLKDDMYNCEDVNIVTREQWRARNAVRSREIHLPVNHVVILHTVTKVCNTTKQCSRIVQFIQDYHLDEKGWWDIGYSFLVGGDGKIYVGRGFQNIGAFTMYYNYISLGIAFIGNFDNDIPTEAMLNAAKNFIKCGIKKGYITPTAEIHGHRDITCTDSPGDKLYAVIRNWNNFKGGRLPNYYCSDLRPRVNLILKSTSSMDHISYSIVNG